MYEYKKEYGSYYLYKNNNIVFMTDEISLIYSYDPEDEIKGTLHKHGTPESVKKYFNEKVLPLKQKIPELFGQFFFITTDKLPVEELNKIINNTGYISKIHEKYIENKEGINNGS